MEVGDGNWIPFMVFHTTLNPEMLRPRVRRLRATLIESGADSQSLDYLSRIQTSFDSPEQACALHDLNWLMGYLWRSGIPGDQSLVITALRELYPAQVYYSAERLTTLFDNGAIPYDNAVLEARLLQGRAQQLCDQGRWELLLTSEAHAAVRAMAEFLDREVLKRSVDLYPSKLIQKQLLLAGKDLLMLREIVEGLSA